MTPLKRFLLIFVVVYVGGGILINIAFGPPGMSKSFMGDHDTVAAYEHYLEVVKSEAYKLWRQNPGLHPPEATPHLADDIRFVEQFEAREDFQHEMHRRERYKLAIETFHVVMMTLLVVKLARRPLARFLDTGVDHIRRRIAHAEAARAEAAKRHETAEAAIERLEAEKAQIAGDGQKLIELELAEITDATERSVEHVRLAAQDRVREEELLATIRLRDQLFDTAVAHIVERFQAQASEADHHRLIADFAHELERPR